MKRENKVSDIEKTTDGKCPFADTGIGHRISEIAGRVGGNKKLATLAGVSESHIYRYMSGQSDPTTSRLIALARAGRVSVSWLATGEGGQEDGGHLDQPAPDLAMLEEVITKTERMLASKRATVTPEAKAKVIRLIYEYCLRQGQQMDAASLNNVIELAAYKAAS